MWWGYPHGFSFFPFVFFPIGFFIFVVLCLIVIRLVFFRRFRRFGGTCGGPMYGPMYEPWSKQGDAEAILKRRLANGDITEEEYKHLRETLKD